MTTEKILEVLQPVRLYTAKEDWMKVAEIITGNEHSANFEALRLMSRFEELTRGKWADKSSSKYEICQKCGIAKVSCYCEEAKVWQPALLKKEHFVCEVEKPNLLDDTWKQHPSNKQFEIKERIEAYQAAQAKLFFEGFESMNKSEVAMNEEISIWFPFPVFLIRQKYGRERSEIICTPTLFDLIYHIDFYNSTAKEPIKLFWMENFINQLIK